MDRIDPELGRALRGLASSVPLEITRDRISSVRAAVGGKRSAEDVVRGRALEFEHATIPGHGGVPITVTVFRRRGPATWHSDTAVLHVHGGGMILGNRFDDIDRPLAWVEQHGVVCVAVEYRLAPEHPHPVPVEDVYAAFDWLTSGTAELNVNSDRVVLFGASAGGGIAAAIAHLARDRGATQPLGQMLIYPMLDDRESGTPDRIEDGLTWDRVSNRTAWAALLGEAAADPAALAAAAPARAERMVGLPAAYIDCGSVDLFLDEDVAYARALWAAGGSCELHIWPGAFHAFDDLVPSAKLTRRALAARDRWFADRIGPARTV